MAQEIDLITGEVIETEGTPVTTGQDDLWPEKYRPRTLEDFVLPKKLENMVRTALQVNSFNNYILYSGASGTGKTSLAMAIPDMLGAESKFLYAKRDSEILEEIDESATYRSLNGRPKFFIIDEADYPSQPDNFYRKLQSCVEATSSNLRFILTCNEIFRIPDPIKSRCMPIAFDHPGDDRDLKNRMFKRLMKIAKTETKPLNGEVSKDTIVEILTTCYPDMRKMINVMHNTFLENSGSIIGHPNIVTDELISNIYRLTVSMDPRRLRYYLSANAHDFRGVYIPFGKYFMERIPVPTGGTVDYMYIKFASMLGKAYRASLSQVNQEVSLMEFLCDVMELIMQCQMVGKMPMDAPQQAPGGANGGV